MDDVLKGCDVRSPYITIPSTVDVFLHKWEEGVDGGKPVFRCPPTGNRVFHVRIPAFCRAQRTAVLTRSRMQEKLISVPGMRIRASYFVRPFVVRTGRT